MNFEPYKFFVGVIDLFSVLLPGAVVVGLFGGGDKLVGSEDWVRFLLLSYLLGHFLFLIGSLLDDVVFDRLREMTEGKQVVRLSNKRELSPRFCRWVASRCFKEPADTALDKVIPIKEGYLRSVEAERAVNAFQWCKARLTLEDPQALAMVNR